MLVAVPVQRTVQIPAPTLESRQSHALPARSAPVRRRQTRGLRKRRGGRRRRSLSLGGVLNGDGGSRYQFLMMTVGRLRWLYQHRFRFGRHRLHGSCGRRLGHHLRLHHSLTVTFGAQTHGRSAAEEPTDVLAHHGALGSLRSRFLCHTLGGHLEGVKKNPTGAQRLHRKMLQKQQRLKRSDLHGLKYTKRDEK